MGAGASTMLATRLENDYKDKFGNVNVLNETPVGSHFGRFFRGIIEAVLLSFRSCNRFVVVVVVFVFRQHYNNASATNISKQRYGMGVRLPTNISRSNTTSGRCANLCYYCQGKNSEQLTICQY